MIDGLKPYSEYRETTHPWLGKVPSHWGEKRAKYFYREVDERSTTGEEELMSVSHKTGVTPRKSHVTMFMAESNVGHKVCRPDDLVINTMWAFMAALGVARQVGVVSPSYGVYRPSQKGELHPDYVDQLLRIEDYKSEYLCRSTGIRSSRLRLYPDQFLQIPILCPPPEEQEAIVRFLDHVDRRVRRYIRAKRQLIERLNELKQATIHRAVTRGLDPNVKLKDSGLTWVPQVPERWELLPNRHFLKRRKLLVGDRHPDFQLLSLTKKGIIIRDVESGEGKFSADMGTSQEVRVGDLVFCLFDVPETPRTVGLSSHFGMITGAYTVFECQCHILRRFVELFYRAMDDRKLLSPLYSGLRNTIPPTVFLHTKTPIPPSDEQLAILDHVEDSTCDVDKAIEKAEAEIILITELRTRIAADVATGRHDVREVAV